MPVSSVVSNPDARAHFVCHLAVPSYNEVCRIVRCLDSVMRSPLPAECSWGTVAILDGASTDGTVELATEWATAHPELPLEIIASERRTGKADALARFHADLLTSGGDNQVVIVLDADAALAPGALEALLGAFIADSEIATVWGTDQIDSHGVRYWASSFQMAAVGAIALASPLKARAYGRFFAYSLKALAEFTWDGSEITDDFQLARFAQERGLRSITESDAKVLVTPAGSFGDFYLQTFRYIQSKQTEGRTVRLPPRFVLWAALTTFIRHPFWGLAYITYRLASQLRWALCRTEFTALWTPPLTTKSGGALQ